MRVTGHHHCRHKRPQANKLKGKMMKYKMVRSKQIRFIGCDSFKIKSSLCVKNKIYDMWTNMNEWSSLPFDRL